jgi:hypothetical protein
VKLFRSTIAAALAVSLLGASLYVAPAYAQRSPGGCTQATSGSPIGSGNRSGRQNSAAVLPAVIAAAVQNVAVPVNALNVGNLNLVCLNDTLNQNDIRILQDILNASPILSNNSNNLNNLLQNALQGSNIAIANGVQVVSVDVGSPDTVFLLQR